MRVAGDRWLVLSWCLEVIAAIAVVVAMGIAASGQEPTPPSPGPPTPTISLAIEGPTEGVRDDYNDFKATGGPEKGTFQWIALPLDNRLRLRETEGGRNLSVVGPPGSYTLLLSVSDGSAKQLDQHEFVIPGDVPTPPKPLTLAQLAGDKAAPIGQVYKILVADIGKDLTTIAMYSDAEEAALQSLGLATNPAIAEIRKRTLGKTLDELKPILEAIITELSTPIVSPATAMFYIYEKDDGVPTASVLAGIDRVNRQTRVRAMTFEEDLPDPTGRFKAAVEAARKEGLPALVLTDGDNVLKVVRNVTTAEQVWGLAQ